MVRHKILFISSWYPTKINPTLGNFVFKHAESVAGFHDLYALHVCMNFPGAPTEETFQQEPFPSKIIYLKPGNTFMLSGIIDKLRIVRRYLAEYRKLLKNGFKPALVNANVVFPVGMIAWLFHLLYRVDYVISEHWTGYHDYATPTISSFQKLILRIITSKAKAILPDSEDLGATMVRKGAKTTIIAVANVANTELFYPEQKPETDHIIRLVHVSTLREDQKNITLLLKAFQQVWLKNPDIELHIVTDGDLENYRSLIAELGIDDRIVNHGLQQPEGVARVVRNSDFFVLTSNFENLPCVIAESLCSGVPVVSTNVGGISEMIHDGNGLIVPPNDLKAMVNAMEKMVTSFRDYDKEKLQQEAVNKYSYQAVGQKLSDIYNQFASSKN